MPPARPQGPEPHKPPTDRRETDRSLQAERAREPTRSSTVATRPSKRGRMPPSSRPADALTRCCQACASRRTALRRARAPRLGSARSSAWSGKRRTPPSGRSGSPRTRSGSRSVGSGSARWPASCNSNAGSRTNVCSSSALAGMPPCSPGRRQPRPADATRQHLPQRGVPRQGSRRRRGGEAYTRQGREDPTGYEAHDSAPR